MASLRISWHLCDGRLIAKWSERANGQPLAHALTSASRSADAELRFTQTTYLCSRKPQRGVLRSLDRLFSGLCEGLIRRSIFPFRSLRQIASGR